MKWRWISNRTAFFTGCALLVAGAWSLQQGVVASSAQGQPVKRDWDGVLEQDEVPDPRIDYTRPRIMPTVVADASRGSNACSRRSVRGLPPPRVEIEEVRRMGQGVEQTIIARGFVEGECLATAGLYVDGVLKDAFQVHTQPAAKRFPFSVSLKSETGAEIRAYTVKSDVAVAQVR